jgi:hypothetical protein
MDYWKNTEEERKKSKKKGKDENVYSSVTVWFT